MNFELLISSLGIAGAFVSLLYLVYWAIQRMVPAAIEKGRRPDVQLEPILGAFGNSIYQATAGGELGDFFDLDSVSLDTPAASETVVDFFVNNIHQVIAGHEDGIPWRICFVEKDSGPVGALTLKALIERHLGQPVSLIRVRRRLDSAAVKGPKIVAGDFVILITDVITSGFQTILACKRLERLGAKVTHCFAAVDRRQGSMSDLERSGLVVNALTNLADLQKAIKEKKGRS